MSSAELLDDPATTVGRRAIIERKPFLKGVYKDWYTMIAAELPASKEPVLELGSGAGFLDQFVDPLITTEILHVPGVKAIVDGGHLPFKEHSLRSIVMTDVLHHLPSVRRFFTEAARAVVPGGTLVMIEPWNTPWARFIWQNFHHEPFLPNAETWDLPPGGPLSVANGAIPWMVFVRDRSLFAQQFPEWRVERIDAIMPFSYLLSGGFTLPSFLPGFLYPVWRVLESGLKPLGNWLGMFALIVVRRR